MPPSPSRMVGLLATLTCALTLSGTHSAQQTAAAKSLKFLAAGEGSAFLPYGRGLSRFLSSQGISIEVVETAGSIDNLSRLIADQHALAAVFMGSAFDAYTGTGSWKSGTSFTH